MSGQKTNNYADVAKHYDKLAVHGRFATLAPHNKGGRKGEYVAAVFDAALLPTLQAHAPRERILDLGCGTGIFTRQAAAAAGEVIGVDISAGMLRVARSVCAGIENVTLLQIDGERLPFADQRFDCVIARESLCYVPDTELPDALAEVRRVLRPGGIMLWLEQVSDDPSWQHHPGAPNVIKRSPAAIRAEAGAAGLLLESERKVRSPRFPWIYAVWFGIVPRALIPLLARGEVAWHARFPGRAKRWWNTLFVMRKP